MYLGIGNSLNFASLSLTRGFNLNLRLFNIYIAE